MGPEHELAVGPNELADAILSSAIGLDADRVWIEPVPLGGAHYSISIERRAAVLATATIDAALATATISRLAVIAEVELTATRATTGTTRIRRGTRAYDLVFTLRPRPEPRAELMLTSRLARRPETYRDLQPGDCVDHYRVIERLGSGGMGQVYRVDQWALGRRYALKVLQAEVVQRDPRSVDRFVQEARAASRIRHPHIIDVFDFGYLNDGRPYFVMELLAGNSLSDIIDSRGPIAPSQALTIARQLVAALGAAHDVGVIHADVTPANILVGGNGVKLLDFGLAELREHTRADVPTGFIMGTPRYVSPEQLHGGKATEASDQYSLGIVLYEMLAGAPPFCSPNLSTLCRQHIYDAVPTITSSIARIPREVDQLVARCLAKSPGHRFAGMHELRTELDAVASLVRA